MDNKTMTIVVVAVVAVVAIAGIAFFMMNNNSSEKDYNATELADKFIKDYDGIFGKFVMADGSVENQAIIGYTAQQKDWQGNDIADKTRNMNVKIVHCETKEEAAAEFDKYLTIKDPPYSTKNGTKGETLVTQTNKLGMAGQHATVLYDTKNITPAEGGELKKIKASDYGADQIYILYAGVAHTETSQQYSQFSGVMQDGKNLIIINQSSKDEFSMYYNQTIMTADEAIEGESYILPADFENAVKTFFKTF